MKLATIIAALAAIIATAAYAEPLPVPHGQGSVRYYDSRGNSLGTAAPQGEGSVRYYDARGNSLGTSTTTPGGTTTFYGPGGNVTGRASGPASPGSGRRGGR
jgi:hypothetical protein